MRPLPLYLLLQRRQRQKKNRSRQFNLRLARTAWVAGTLVMLVLAVAALALAWIYSELTHDLPPATRLPTLLNPNDGLYLQPTRLYDRTGQHLLLTLADPGSERRYLVFDPLKPDHFSPFLIQAAIGAEEPGFWQSPGFSLARLLDPEPATIAEQLVNQLLLADEPHNLRHALRMRLLAAQLTSRYGRAQVLEWHLNSAYYGRLAYGAESAARLYLGKTAADLNLAESALMAAVQQAPALNPLDAPQAALDRERALLVELLIRRVVDPDQFEIAQSTPPVLRAAQPAENQIAPAFTRLVVDQLTRRYGRSQIELGGLDVTTSLDIEAQNQLSCTLLFQLARSEGRTAQASSTCETSSLLPALPVNFHPLPTELQGSAVLLDLTDGRVLAFAGDSTSVQEGTASAGHAPGTLLTPFLAVSAFSRGFGPASLVWDIPGQLTTQLETATHPAGKYIGPLSLRQALANDTLAPLQDLLNQIGPANTWQISEPFGLTGLAQSQDPSRVLFEGGSIRLLDLAQAYSTLANLGVRMGQRAAPGANLEPNMVLKVEDRQGRQLLEAATVERQPVVTAPLAYLVHNVLSDEPARWTSLGHPNLLEIGRPAGAKLGSTADGRQTWTAGYTTQRLVVTWMGLPEGVSSETQVDPRLAAGLWHALIQSASRSLPATGWTVPDGVTKMDVCSPSGLLPTRACPNVVNELFLTGNEPTGPDQLYRTFQVNRETGMLATVFTPAELVEEKTYLVLPEEARAWGKLAGLAVPPQDYDFLSQPAAIAGVEITKPAAFSAVRGMVTIEGSAAGDNFSYYQLQVGQGLNPSEWLPLGGQGNQAVKNGKLGTWDTSQANGLYALRLQVIRQDHHLDTAVLQVTVDNTPPRARILTPQDGQKLTFSSQPVAFQAEASDAVGLQRVEFWIDGILTETRSSAPYSLAWAPLRGQHTFKIVAYDLAGNSSEAQVQFSVQ